MDNLPYAHVVRERILATKTAKTVINIKKLSPTHFVSNIDDLRWLTLLKINLSGNEISHIITEFRGSFCERLVSASVMRLLRRILDAEFSEMDLFFHSVATKVSEVTDFSLQGKRNRRNKISYHSKASFAPKLGRQMHWFLNNPCNLEDSSYSIIEEDRGEIV